MKRKNKSAEYHPMRVTVRSILAVKQPKVLETLEKAQCRMVRASLIARGVIKPAKAE